MEVQVMRTRAARFVANIISLRSASGLTSHQVVLSAGLLASLGQAAWAQSSTAAPASSVTAPPASSVAAPPARELSSPVNLAVEPAPLNQRVLSFEEALLIADKQSRDLLAAREHLRGAYADVERARAALLPTVSAQGKLTINEPEVSLTLDQSGSVFGSAYQGAQILDLQLATGSAGARGPAASVLYNTYCNSTDPNRVIPGGVQQVCGMLGNPSATNVDAAINAANVSATIVPRFQLDAGLNVNVPLVVPSAYPALSGAKTTYRAQEKQLAVTTVQVLQNVAVMFFQAAGLEEVVLARQNAIGVAQKTLDDAKIRLSAGVANRVDVTRAEQAVIKAKQDLLESQGSRGTSYLKLATLLKLKAGSFKVLPPPEPPEEAGDSSQLINQALSQRPELANLELVGRAASEQAKASLLRWAPTLSAFGNIRLTNATGFSGRVDYYAAGLQLDWQLFDGLIRESQRHQFESQRRETELRLELFREQVSDEVTVARSNLVIRRRGLAAAQSSVRLAKEALDLVRVQYEAGTATQLDLLTAQDKLVQADVGLAQARFDLALSAFDLRRALGDSLSASAPR
jgi:outer membrane protein TolC